MKTLIAFGLLACLSTAAAARPATQADINGFVSDFRDTADHAYFICNDYSTTTSSFRKCFSIYTDDWVARWTRDHRDIEWSAGSTADRVKAVEVLHRELDKKYSAPPADPADVDYGPEPYKFVPGGK